jgi:predicted TIM-barrel fold metal-dependent hydrolase
MLFDSHSHILPPSFTHRGAELRARDSTFASLFPNVDAKLATAATLIEAMDRVGIDRAVVMGMGWNNIELAREANDYITESVTRYPNRLTGFCSVNPAWGDAAVMELERCVAAGLRGIGELHPDSQGFDITDKSMLAAVMNTAYRLGLPILVHSSEPVGHKYPGKGNTTPQKLYRFILNFPENTIICAHWGGGLPFYALMPEVQKAIRNVYFDTAASTLLYQPEVFPAVINLVGANKVLLGTDFPLVGHMQILEQIRQVDLDPMTRQGIMGNNAARLFNI